jgi:predicted ATP-grasp superfamily ATP-dependent carboligase
MSQYRNGPAHGAAVPPSRESEAMLVVAVSGRALAASARRSGRRVTVLDLFADRDTRREARVAEVVRAARALRFDRRRLLRAAGELAPGASLVYGAGFEGSPGLLARLASGRRLLGNRPEVLALVRDPARFFPLLDRLGVPHPPVRSDRPAEVGGWLVKRPGGSGGAHIRAATGQPAAAAAYYQRQEPGAPHSALFLADGRRAMIIGFNRQWTTAARPSRPFLYGGAVGGVTLPQDLTREIAGRLDAVVEATGVVGLNGLDFLLAEGRWSVLELNPRPTATMELYDPDYPDGLFQSHLDAVDGTMPLRPVPPGAARAHQVIHAGRPWTVPEAFVFPDWCRDLPSAGAAMAAGDPVCTVHAEGASAESALDSLQARRFLLEESLEAGAIAPAVV